MSSATRLLNSIKSTNVDTISEVMFGTVTSINPLKIEIEGLQELPESFFVLTPFCFDNKITFGTLSSDNPVTHTPSTIDSSNDIHSHTIMVWKGLSVNDKVVLTSHNKGQKFIVHCKVGGWL